MSQQGAPVDVMRDLLSAWHALHLQTGPALSDRELQQFERRFHMNLPLAFRRYLLIANGMWASGWDSALIHFWTLDEIAEHLSEPGVTEQFPFVPFADYSIECWVWALPLGPAGEVADSVSTFGPPLAPCANSFAQFVSRYLSGEDLAPKVLTPRKGQLHWRHGA
jgi:hypothetical protein